MVVGDDLNHRFAAPVEQSVARKVPHATAQVALPAKVEAVDPRVGHLAGVGSDGLGSPPGPHGFSPSRVGKERLHP